MDTLLTVFIALTGLAVLMQAGVLFGMYLAMRKSSERMESLAEEVKTKVMPAIEQANQLLTITRPKLEVIIDNVEGASTLMRSEIERVDATVNDVIDRARLQVIRADELLSRTMDRVEQTSEMVQNTVVSPVRQVTGLMRGIGVGLEFFFGNRGRRNGGNREERRPLPQDEMFI